MLERVQGVLEGVGSQGVLVRLGGVTLHVLASQNTLRALGPVGATVTLYTHLIVREDGLQLYGFATQEERELFLRLLSVNGVGPRSALALCSLLSPSELTRAIEEADADALSRVPGIGRRLAGRIILELRGKLAEATPIADPELLEALLALGYTRAEASSAIASLPRSVATAPLEERLRAALRYFAGQ
jgi:Holliday junction DNA helicase RuvA